MAVAAASATTVSEVLTLKDTSRAPQFMEMYSKMHYEDKVQPRTQELIQSLRDKNMGKLPSGGSLACVRQALKEVYSTEPESTREEVLEKIAEHAKFKEERKLAQEERTPEAFLE